VAIVTTRQTIKAILFYTMMQLGAWVMSLELLDMGAPVL
jgi:hypothetical protein